MDALDYLELSLLDLPFEMRARLVFVLTTSLDEEAIGESWKAEIEHRWQQYLAGEIRGIPGKKAMEEIRRALQEGR